MSGSGSGEQLNGPRIRNKGLRRVRVADIEDAPFNFRMHPENQAAALGGAIDELGFYGYPDVWEPSDGRIQLCDGHLRKELLLAKYGPDAEIEVNVTDFSEAEAKKATLTKDPLAALAESDPVRLDELLRDVQSSDPALQQMLADLADDAGLYQDDDGAASDASDEVEAVYQVVVECESEADQKKVYEAMKKKGIKCRVLTV